jgi:hypothetical protein
MMESINDNDLIILIEKLLNRITPEGTPNGNRLNETFRDYSFLSSNVKIVAYEIARLKRRLDGIEPSQPSLKSESLGCRLCTAADLESGWAAHWRKETHLGFTYHRKDWEVFYVLQSLYENFPSLQGRKGLGFACGHELIPSYLVSQGASILASDAPPELASTAGWESTDQHSSGKEALYLSHLVSREQFDANLNFRFIDMNQIPGDLQGQFDFCWSVCSAEHLGSIEKGLAFLENSLSMLKPGGISIHTLEYTLDERETIDNWATVLFQKKHIELLAERVKDHGNQLLPHHYGEGDSYYDRYVDTPPFYSFANEIHLKLSVDGFRSTSFGLALKKGGVSAKDGF